MSSLKGEPTETFYQTQTWDRVKSWYLSLGLCHKCAAQIAYGHQNNAGGWTSIQPPCERCDALVQEFPEPTRNPLWRKYRRPQSRVLVCPPCRNAQRSVEQANVPPAVPEGAL